MAEPQISHITQSQTTIPDYARSYVENLLGLSEGTAFQYQRDAQGNVVRDAAGLPIPSGFQPYQQYQGERFAQFSPLQQRAFEQAEQMTPSNQLEDASSLAGLAGLRALNYGYTPGQATNQFSAPQQFQPSQFTAPGVSSQDLQRYQMGAPDAVRSMAVRAPKINAQQTTYVPNLTAHKMDKVTDVSTAGTPVTTRDINAAKTEYRPDLETFQMGPAERVSTRSFVEPGSAAAYMSPYMQNVVDIEKREAERQAEKASAQRGAKFAQAGAFGGARQAIENAEAARNLAMQQGDIQSKGLQSAYQQAQQQFNAEQQARLTGQQANQQAGLTVGQQNLAAQLGVQQLGAGQIGLQTSLANLNADQQARVQTEANRLQASGMTAQQALQAAMANQQMGFNVGQQNLQSQQNTQQLGTQTGLQTALANLNASQQTAVQNAANSLQARGMTAQQALQAALANQQAGLNVGQQNLSAMLGVQQLGSGQNLQAQLANQQAQMQAQQLAEQSKQYGYGQQLQAAGLGAQYGQAAQQLNEQSAQFGAGLGLQGLQTAMQGAGQLGSLGQQQFGQQMGINQLMGQYGGMQQQQAQNILGAQYQDFLSAQNQPYKQLGFMSDMLRGLPLSQSASTMYQQPPSMLGQVAGAGLTAKGLGLFAKGGAVNSRSAGLADLAISRMG